MTLLPDMESSCYVVLDGAVQFTEWTRSSLILSPSFLNEGENQLEMGYLDSEVTVLPDLQAKEFRLQLKYPWEKIQYFDLRRNR